MITIKGEEPITCMDCPCIHFGENGAWDYCQAMPRLDRYAIQSEKLEGRPKWCPIVERKERKNENTN